MKPILQVIGETLRNEEPNTVKFVQQLRYLLQQENRESLAERLAKGSAYYTVLLSKQLASLLLHMQHIQWRSGVKTYLNMLGEVDQLLMKKYEDIAKSAIIIQGLLDRETFIDVSTVEKERDALRKSWLDAARAEASTRRQSAAEDQFGYVEKKRGRKPRAEKGSARSKRGQKDTVAHTLELYRLGKTVEEISVERVLTVGTIESHLTKAIASGRLELNDYVSIDESSIIEAAIAEHGATGLRAVFDALEERYSFGKIRAVAAKRMANGEW
ncbi:MAG: helix-turn-helix domain-containing protein [Flavobacteriales bacterium]